MAEMSEVTGVAHPPFSLVQYEDALLLEPNPHVDFTYAPPTEPTLSEPLLSPEILHAMLPPREWKEFSGTWRQHVSMVPSTRADVVALQEQLDAMLVQEQTKKQGICANRERLHAQVFDEVIRQVTLACPERGLLLLRIRDEIRMTIEAYQALYNTSLSFGIRKTVMAEEGMQAVDDELRALQATNAELREARSHWMHRLKVLEHQYATEREARAKQQANVVGLLRDQIQHFQAFGELRDSQ
ncbi:hypothetical protein SPRG_09301 [Saprolegnia parasitica CBS 223.65]|uniref:Uncharacterized protein n=1 Tax=Saprolegnia parasitica (strain CBS 223.65) TaxID=695850 RepID=A0A067CEC8_SAPPC|nr:hypothetical protein SPRG_09301 [Saprolegnia parasitica CBS 223.65]KDO25152.1 hypothetical protein SPRG_09301 [Saprolegnia parasitica CBS 223.65]|eukprot:XP_012204220.1 hypothetical protein SPRG_09301 [Saprolegnia parasitica CBS 223.65]